MEGGRRAVDVWIEKRALDAAGTGVEQYRIEYFLVVTLGHLRTEQSAEVGGM